LSLFPWGILTQDGTGIQVRTHSNRRRTKIISQNVETIQREAAKIMWNRIAKSGNGIEAEQSFESYWD
jgi:hypothetical protein